MAPAKVMLIRHAEKPDGTGNVMGVSELGLPHPRQLSVRGWQRAGALVRFFAPAGGNFADGIATPSAIFALQALWCGKQRAPIQYGDAARCVARHRGKSSNW